MFSCYRRYGGISALAAIFLFVGACTKEESHPSFAGVWKNQRPFTNPFPMVDASLYTPKYAKEYQDNKQAVTDGTLDLGANCSPPGVVRAWEVGQFEILDAPKNRITILHEFMTQVRRLNIGREHPEHLDPTVSGDSVAHWEGDTLVVDTQGISEFSFLDRNAAPHSDELKLVERFTLMEPDVLKVDTTVTDPKALIKPWQFSNSFQRVLNGELIDYECTENPRNPIGPDGSVGFEFKTTK